MAKASKANKVRVWVSAVMTNTVEPKAVEQDNSPRVKVEVVELAMAKIKAHMEEANQVVEPDMAKIKAPVGEAKQVVEPDKAKIRVLVEEANQVEELDKAMIRVPMEEANQVVEQDKVKIRVPMEEAKQIPANRPEDPEEARSEKHFGFKQHNSKNM
ncbi:uncharacterized protein ACMZJ9_015355 isoform 13-T13 [Mantella aurantiaca]